MTTSYTHVTVQERARAEVRDASRYDPSDSLSLSLDGDGHTIIFHGTNPETFEHFLATVEAAIQEYRRTRRLIQECAAHHAAKVSA